LVALRQRCADALGIEPPPFAWVSEPNRVPGTLEVRLGERVLERTAISDEAEPAAGDEVLLLVFRAVMDHADELVDLQDVDEWIERVRETRPAVVQSALEVARPVDLLHVVRGLLRERIALPPFAAIVDVVADGRVFRQASARPHWPRVARERLAGYWVRDLLDAVAAVGPAQWVRPYRDAEEALMAQFVVSEDGVAGELSGAERRAWIERLREGEGPHVVLCTGDARAALAEVLRDVHPHVPVLSTAELAGAGVQAPARDQVRWVHAPT
jgi:flagellar biosynthesis component FlhA